MAHPLAGIYVALVTPMKPDLAPDLEALPNALDFMAQRGCHGVLILGTTGEGPSFSVAESLDIFRAASQIHQVRPDFRLLAGTGTPSLTATMEVTEAVFKLDYAGVVVLPPYYYRKASDEGLFAWFSDLLSKAVPASGYLLGYHFPSAAGVSFSLDLLSRLKDAFPGKFAGIKDSSHDVDFACQLGTRFGDDLLVLNGTDAYLQLAMQAKAQGCITAPANLISPDLRCIWDGFQQGKDISSEQEHVSKLRYLLEKYLPFPPVLKALLSQLHGFPFWKVRPPLVDLDGKTVAQALAEYQSAYIQGG